MAHSARSPSCSLHYPSQRTLKDVSGGTCGQSRKYLQIAPHLVPSNEELIRAAKNWPTLTADKDCNVPACPIHFSDEEAE
jgi:hypothetical protein